jgi:hypothetical protein
MTKTRHIEVYIFNVPSLSKHLTIFLYTICIFLQILLLTGDPRDRPFLIHMANLVTMSLNLLRP